jgi:phosphopentomutase
VVSAAELRAICEQCREITRTPPHLIARVIARPFAGNVGAFVRTADRHDYPLNPPGVTILNALVGSGLEVIGIGKISEIFNHSGITRNIPTKSNRQGMQELTRLVSTDFHGITFTNLVDFDSMFGHRRDVTGYARALAEFDADLPKLLNALGQDDLLVITADHGNDPTFRGSDHTRERVPLLAFTPRHERGISLGLRQCFADVAATIAQNFGLQRPQHGSSFLDLVLSTVAT